MIKTTDKSQYLKIAKQAIYDSDSNIFAYELLYRKSFNTEEEGDIDDLKDRKDDEFTTLRLISNIELTGLNRITDGKRAFINFGSQFLSNQIPTFFQKDKIGIEILETVEPEPKIIESCLRMKKQGYIIILDDFVYRDNLELFLEIADIVKIDFLITDSKERIKTINKLKKYNIKFLAEKIENESDYKQAIKEGFELFQGYFFKKPEIISIPHLPGYKINFMNILKIINKQKIDREEIKNILSREISLTYRFLRFIRLVKKKKAKVKSIGEALEIFTDEEIKNYLSLIVLSSIGVDEPQFFLNNAIIRAKFYELIAEKTGNDKDTYFLLGMFSKLDFYLKIPMKDLLKNISLDKKVKRALRGKNNKYSKITKLVNNYESKDEKVVSVLLKKFKISKEDLDELYIKAIELGNSHY